MKKLLLTTLTMLCAMSMSAQNIHEWTHTGNYPLSQCYDILEMSDGNLVVKEAVFDENLHDIGVNLYKITPECEVIDSLFIEDQNINHMCPMLRDPNSTDSNIMISFFNGTDKRYYQAIYFNDNLEITKETLGEYPEGINFPDRFLVDSNNDIICRVTLDNTPLPVFCLMKIGLDGEIKKVSGKMSGVHLFPQYALFELSSSPMQYGYATCDGNGMMTVEIFDEDFNRIKWQRFRPFGDWNSITTHEMNVCGMSDGHFVMSFNVYNIHSNPQQITEALCMVKINGELEVEATYVWNEGYDRTLLLNKNLIATEEGVYVVWSERIKSDNQYNRYIVVSFLDSNLNFVWQNRSTIFSLDLLMGYGLTLLDNGGLALSGWIKNIELPYQTKTIYAMVVDNDVWATEEVQDSGKTLSCSPNPTTGLLSLYFSLDSDSDVEISVYDMLGKVFKRILLNKQNRGSHTCDISLSDAPDGMYICMIKTSEGKTETRKIIVKH